MLTLSKIESHATSARLAGLYVKSINVAALYAPGQIVATIVWSLPIAYSEPSEPLKGVAQTGISRPSDTCLVVGVGAADEIEAQLLSAAWSLGAWDIRRIESAPLADPAEWAQPRHGIASIFGAGGYVIAGQPTTMGASAPGAAQQAAITGWVHWHFIPLALASHSMRERWAGKDQTLPDASCSRGARVIEPRPLAGRQVPGFGHEHIYRLGRNAHSNRGQAKKDRRD